jgi:hypothetical protein
MVDEPTKYSEDGYVQPDDPERTVTNAVIYAAIFAIAGIVLVYSLKPVFNFCQLIAIDNCYLPVISIPFDISAITILSVIILSPIGFVTGAVKGALTQNHPPLYSSINQAQKEIGKGGAAIEVLNEAVKKYNKKGQQTKIQSKINEALRIWNLEEPYIRRISEIKKEAEEVDATDHPEVESLHEQVDEARQITKGLNKRYLR